jgi:hypothetical protein
MRQDSRAEAPIGMGSAGHQRKACAPTRAMAFTRSGVPHESRPVMRGTRMRWPRPAEGGWTAGAIARIAWRPVWLAPWERSRSTRGDVSHESPRATALRKWVPTPMWALRAVFWLFALRPPAGIQGDIRVREVPGLPATTLRAGRSPRRHWVHANGYMALTPYWPSGPCWGAWWAT